MFDAAVRERSESLVRTLLDSVRIASVSLTGEGIADQVSHAPNESTKVSLYLAGVRTGLHLIAALGER